MVESHVIHVKPFFVEKCHVKKICSVRKMAIARLPRKIENVANIVVYKGGYKWTIGTTRITLLFSYIYKVYKIVFKIKLIKV